MLQELIAMRPASLANLPPAVAIAATAAGAGFWVVGGRFSRGCLTLALVAIGAWVGMNLPRWFRFDMEGMALGIIGALVLGFSGYMLHRTWVGLMLGVLLAVWAGTMAWVVLAPGAEWVPKGVAWTGSASEFLRQVWASLPPPLARVMPVVTVGSMAVGIATALVWQRMSQVLAFDLLGLSLLVLLGLPLVAKYQPQWMTYVPRNSEQQVVALVLLVLLGVAIQWRLTPAPEGTVVPAERLGADADMATMLRMPPPAPDNLPTISSAQPPPPPPARAVA